MKMSDFQKILTNNIIKKRNDEAINNLRKPVITISSRGVSISHYPTLWSDMDIINIKCYIQELITGRKVDFIKISRPKSYKPKSKAQNNGDE
jgi:hypothetical protein